MKKIDKIKKTYKELSAMSLTELHAYYRILFNNRTSVAFSNGWNGIIPKPGWIEKMVEDIIEEKSQSDKTK